LIAALSAAQKSASRSAVEKFGAAVQHGHGSRRGPRVKGIRRAFGMFELTWADDSRATFS